MVFDAQTEPGVSLGSVPSESTGVLRTSPDLVCYWRGGDLVLESFAGGVAYAVDAETVRLLGMFSRGADIAAATGGSDDVRLQVLELRAAGLLLDPAAFAARRRALAAWDRWPVEAAFFHFGSKDTRYLPRDGRGGLFSAVSAEPPPPPVKRVAGPRLRLPPPARTDVPLSEALQARRTTRRFVAEPVPLERFATILGLSFGAKATVSRAFGVTLRKTSPSAGGRHPLECTVAVLAVEGVAPGVYHYDCLAHELVQIRDGLTKPDLTALTPHQPYWTNAGFVCFLTAVLDRVSYKYRVSRAYRLLYLDAGHVGQTFSLVATAQGLGAFQTAAIEDTPAEEFLGVDGAREPLLYVVGAGHVDPAAGDPASLPPEA